MQSDRLTTTLLVLAAAALALGILTAFIIFYPTGSYKPVIIKGNNSSSSAPSNTPTTTPTSTVSSTPAAPGQFASTYSYPYPVAWTEGHENFSVTGASFQNNQLTLTLAVQAGSAPDCVAVNVRLVADETGTLKAPDSPASNTFTFPDTQTCTPTPNSTYSESLVFQIDPLLPPPFLLTSGGAANVFFNVAPNSTGGVDIALPARSG